jgi:hypothetical protein
LEKISQIFAQAFPKSLLQKNNFAEKAQAIFEHDIQCLKLSTENARSTCEFFCHM